MHIRPLRSGWRPLRLTDIDIECEAQEAAARVAGWRKETRHGNGKCPTDLKRNAKAALKRFIWCLQSLPTHEAAPLCQIALAEVAAMCRA